MMGENNQITIDYSLYLKLLKLGMIPTEERSFNVGASDYSKHVIQPWSIWLDWDLNPFDADIVKRVLRTKGGESRIVDYEKIIHICKERIRQLENEFTIKKSNSDYLQKSNDNEN